MNSIINWLKHNKLVLILIAVIGWLLLQSNLISYAPMLQKSISLDMAESYEAGSLGSPLAARDSYLPPVPDEAPPSDSANRLVIKDTNLSLKVKDVSQAITQIETKAQELGGFLVNSNLNRPEEAASGNITVRVPTQNLNQALEAFKSYGIKVVSESVTGRDVTDQYEDITAKLTTLNQTKAKFESIMESAEEIQDILQIQRELISLQSQIDNLKGRQEYLEKSASLSRVTIYLATDELALPYAPDESWRPEVIFKQAVRSLVRNVREIGSLLIWLAVYTPIWVPILLVIWWFTRRRRSTN